MSLEDLSYNKVPNITSNNILLNKHQVRTISCGSSGTLETKLAENGRKAVFASPAVYDFVCNMITLAKTSGNALQESGVEVRSLDETGYYLLTTTEKPFRAYFPDNTDRKLFINHLSSLKANWILAHTETKTGYELQRLSPFMLAGEKIIVNKSFDSLDNALCYQLQLFIAKAVFKPFLIDNWQSGYIYLPPVFYPKIMEQAEGTGINKGFIKAIYKANILGLTKNTHKKDSIQMSRGEFVTAVMPEKAGKNGWLANKDFEGLREAITAKDGETSLIGKTAKDYGNKFRLVKNIFLGHCSDYKSEEKRETELYFTKPEQNPYSKD